MRLFNKAKIGPTAVTKTRACEQFFLAQRATMRQAKVDEALKEQQDFVESGIGVFKGES